MAKYPNNKPFSKQIVTHKCWLNFSARYMVTRGENIASDLPLLSTGFSNFNFRYGAFQKLPGPLSDPLRVSAGGTFVPVGSNINCRLLTAYLLLWVNCDNIMHAGLRFWCVKCTNLMCDCIWQASKLKRKCFILSQIRSIKWIHISYWSNLYTK